MLKPPPKLSDVELQQRWYAWLMAHSYQRLHSACHILEAYQALLIPQPQPAVSSLDSGLTLWFPLPTRLWDMKTAQDWQFGLQEVDITVNEVGQVLDDVAAGVPLGILDEFQSNVLTACFATSQVLSRQPFLPFQPEIHIMFAAQNSVHFKALLNPSPYVQLMFEMINLATCTPLKALVAVSGESWLLTQKLSTSAAQSNEIFIGLKQELRLWSNGIQQDMTFGAMMTMVPGPSTAASAPSSPAIQALACAKRILSLALHNSSSQLPSFGPEITVFYAALVLWALTYSSSLPAGDPIPGFGAESLDPASSEAALLLFLDDAIALSLQGTTLPSISWRRPIDTLLEWTARSISGGDLTKQASGVGELMEGVITVLERLGKKGWVEGWF